jgi:hypothetical protein
MDRLVKRLVEADEASVLMSMATLLYGLPRPIDRVDAIAVFPGLGEDWRMIDTIQAWNENENARHLFIAGVYEGEKTKTQHTIEYLSQAPFNLKRKENVHIQQIAYNTKDQAEWLVEQIRKNNISSFALFISPYYLLRAYCTVLKTFMKADLQVPIIPVPVAVNPATIIPEIGVNAWEMVHGEKERIIKYQAFHDVATLDELKKYLAWLCEQSVISNNLKG